MEYLRSINILCFLSFSRYWIFIYFKKKSEIYFPEIKIIP